MKNTKKRNQRELAEHKAYLDWFKRQYPKIMIHHSPNEGLMKFDKDGKPNYREINKQTKLGMIKGFPDLFIIMPRNEKHGLFIEIKDGFNGEATPEQLEFVNYANKNDYVAIIANNCDAAITATKAYFQ